MLNASIGVNKGLIYEQHDNVQNDTDLASSDVNFCRDMNFFKKKNCLFFAEFLQ